jgi:cytochrome oxidase assembly protein ShyY1
VVQPSPPASGTTDPTVEVDPAFVTERDANGEIVASKPPVLKERPPADWSFVYHFGWILSHLFVLACIVAFINLGFWQLSRLHGRRQVNAMIEARMASSAVPIQSLVKPGENYKVANHRDFRNVTVTGRYDTSQQMLIRDEQDAQDDPGWWLVTPMILPDGSAVAINRGFVPLTLGESGLLANDENKPVPQYDPPKGTVTVTGLLFPTQNRSGGPYDPGTGHLHTLSRVDLFRWQRQVPFTFYTVYVNLVSSQPAQRGVYPQPVPPPSLGDGPHLNYAGQWFIFATLTAIVYPLLLRKHARDLAVVEEDATVAAPA